MASLEAQPPIRVITAVDDATLDGLVAAEGMGAYFDTPEPVIHMLRHTADSSDGRVAVALADDDRMVGYICGRNVVRDAPYDPPIVDIVTVEVAHAERRRGIFRAMFDAMFGDDLEDLIVCGIADPHSRAAEESLEDCLQRAQAVLGSVGFVPAPTGDETPGVEDEAVLFVRVGAQVRADHVRTFFSGVGSSRYGSVAIALEAPVLRNVLRAELERTGFRVLSARASEETAAPDVVITDADEFTGRELTVRLGDDIEVRTSDRTLHYPADELDSLPDILQSQLGWRPLPPR